MSHRFHNEGNHQFIYRIPTRFLTMGLLFTRLWSLFTNEEHKVIIVGLDNAGKTTILYQFLMNEVVHTSPTIGSNVEEVIWKNIHFLMWDIGGQETLRSAWNTYYSNAQFVILVVDSTDRERLSITKEELCKMLNHEDLRKAAMLIFANKQDVKGSMSAAEISQHLNLTSIKDHPWHIQGCCALTGEGLYQGLEWITSKLKGRWPLVWHKVKYQGSKVHQTLEEDFKSFGSVLICFVFPDYSAPSPKYLTQTQPKFSGTVATKFDLQEQILIQWFFLIFTGVKYLIILTLVCQLSSDISTWTSSIHDIFVGDKNCCKLMTKGWIF